MKTSLLPILVCLTLASCAPLPRVSTQAPSQKVPVGWGPEDLVLDSSAGVDRLLISCDDRRNHPCTWSGIVAYELEGEKIDTLARVGEPEGLLFHPHGISLQKVGDETLLYVISHGDEDGENVASHPVVVYAVEPDRLVWRKTFQSDLFRSPNSLVALDDGGFYLSNDAWKRGSFMEKLLKQKKSQLIYCDREGRSKVVEKRVAYGNGVASRDGYLYQSSTRKNLVYRYKMEPDGSLSGKTTICKHLSGADNLRFDGDRLLVAAHPRPFAFLGHAKDSTKHSPSMICAFDPAGFDPSKGPLDHEIVFYDDGSAISGGSTGLIFNDRLYISQVFQPYILVVMLK